MDSLVKAGVPIAHRDQLPSSSRYELIVRIASGGMATVYVGRKSGAVGFWRLVAIKRAHAHLLEEAAFGRMLIAEARLAARIHHPNVVAVQDVEELEGELLLIMDYVEGASLSALVASAIARDTPLPPAVAIRITLDACAGLHAAHELRDEDGELLNLVHRDVSPQNILVGIDGVTRIADFGIAKSAHGATAGTATGALKGKVGYMAPEYVETGELDARGDVWALGVVLWETLAGRRLFRGQSELETLRAVLAYDVARPSSIAPWLPPSLDAVVLRALARDPRDRFASARAFGAALEAAAQAERLVASHAEVGECASAIARSALETRRELVRQRLATEPSGVRAARPSRPFVDDEPAAIEATPFRTATLPQPPVPRDWGGEDARDRAAEADAIAAASRRADPGAPDGPRSASFTANGPSHEASTLASGVSRPNLHAPRTPRMWARNVAAWGAAALVAFALAWTGLRFWARRAAPLADAARAAAPTPPRDDAPSAAAPSAAPGARATEIGGLSAAASARATEIGGPSSAASARATEIGGPSAAASVSPASAAPSTPPRTRPRNRPRSPSPAPSSAPASVAADRAPPNPYAR